MPLPGSKIVHPRLHEKVTGWRGRGLPDSCTITRVDRSAIPALDPVTGILTPPPPTTIYTGPCTVQPAPSTERTVESGDTQLVIRKYYASIAADAAAVDIDDVLTVTATHDPRLIGRPLVVVDVTYDTFQSRRLLTLQDRPGVNP